ncbi:anaerobic ribonucleoside-triphosphate reductase activating protein [bacterium]|jgi:pyruvate formate lyase activating enzyme|nr:anaerobic ribonucleoside-triphosphate reductase activating protein [bacterium]MBT6831547.1 anaerobic ribonucleoside-triphosphate reductase activating protein [bacterium]MBT6996106.1 anaerobic ribonucleoside-triphosphate reductase activating protein [bacterium]MBT7772738.1 anaerobic ribonucleoside-triphosphate reductase activating protein [bacterium]
MLIGGINTLTLLDFPGKVSAIVFTAGCNFRCGYCHNPEFVIPDQLKKLMPTMIPEEKIFKFLETRKEFLDGVVVTGGEPTMHADLPEFCEKIKKMGFLVKLDTNGTNPEMMEKLFEKKLVDYVAMDVKHPLEKYPELVNIAVDPRVLRKSIRIIKKSGLDHEFRTTVVPKFHGEKELEQIATEIAGGKKYTIQNFRPAKTLDPTFEKLRGFTSDELKSLKKVAEKFVEKVQILN